MSFYKLVCPCILGAEGLVADELKNMQAQNVITENGRVIFDGNPSMMMRANIHSRYSERVLILLGEFNALSFEDLFEGTKSLPWEEFIGSNYEFPVTGKSLSSKLTSVPDCQSIVKKAIVERLKKTYKTDWFKEDGPVCAVKFLIMKDKVSLMIDTSGNGLHKRGYRKNSSIAPIKETLAAIMVKLSRIRSDAVFYDPFCGSGTILIEAAMYAYRIAPGIKRRFSSEKWGNANLWKEERDLALSQIDKTADFKAFGYDIDPKSVALALENAKKAGVGSKIEISRADIKDFRPSDDFAYIITNPPYGERLLDLNKARELYSTMGKVFEQKRGYRYTVISPDEEFEDIFGRRADKRRKLYNGMLKCQVYMYFK